MLAAGLATIGLIVPQAAIVAAMDAPSGIAQVPIVDVTLTQDNLLRGQLVDRQGTPQAGKEMTLAVAGRIAAKTVTDNEGHFALRVAKGGVYVLSDGERSVLIRAWTGSSAPPSAKAGVLMISDENLARGALGGGGISLGTIIGVTAIAGVVTAVAVAVSDDAS